MKRISTILRAKELKPLRNVVFVICCTLLLVHQITERILHLRIRLADNYLDAFLATPILLTLLLVERRTLFSLGRNYTLSVAEACLATVFIAAVGEVLFPYLSDNFASDWLDVLFYILGSILFYTTINKTGQSVWKRS